MVRESRQSVPISLLNPLLRVPTRFPQFVLETEELKQRQIVQQCTLKCALVGSTGSPLNYHLALGMGTSTFCTVVRFCTRSFNFALHRPLGFEPNTLATETVRCCNRSELRSHLPKLRLVEQGTEDPEHRYPTRKYLRWYCGRYLKDARFWGRRPELSAPLPSRVGENLTATRRCGTTTPANSSDGRSGHCAPPASRQHLGNQHGKTKEERREGGSTPQKDKQGQGRVGETCASALTRRSGLLAQVRVCSDKEPLVELPQVGRHNSWCSKP